MIAPENSISSPNELDEKQFSIGDVGFIFDILQSKMYSNPILAVCREYSCNARDSHREAGKPTDPIHIHLPNNTEPFFKVKDFGVGISPERIENVFIKYGVSSKREDSAQCGFFGLGSKVAFSYVSSFSIITNYNGTQYNYSCFIDETKIGKLLLLSEEPTDSCNGTEIIVPVKPQDFHNFARMTEQACRHWAVKPTIKGGHISWTECRILLSSPNKWEIVSAQYNNRQPIAIIDGIEYPIDRELINNDKHGRLDLTYHCKGSIVMYFGIGELSLSSNRETIYLDNKSKKLIRSRIADIQGELTANLKEKISNCSNLYEAHIIYIHEYISSFNSVSFLGDMSWNGVAIADGPIRLNCGLISFNKGVYSYKRGNDPNKIKANRVNSINFSTTSELFVNDLGTDDITARHVKKAFDDDPSLKSLQLICPNENQTIDMLNDKYHLDMMAPKLLSSITKLPVRRGTVSSARLIYSKYSARTNSFNQTSLSDIKEDKSKKVLCSIKTYNSGKMPILKGDISLSINAIKEMSLKFSEYSFYGIDYSIDRDRVSGSFVDIEDFIEDNISVRDFRKVKHAASNGYQLDHKMIGISNAIIPLIKDGGSLFLNRLNLHKDLKDLAANDYGLLIIYEAINGPIGQNKIDELLLDNPQFNIASINEQFNKKYPLLRFVDAHYYNDIANYIADYVNMVDGA